MTEVLKTRPAFSSPRSQFFTIRTDPKPANNFFFPALIFGLQLGLPPLLLNWFTCRLQTIVKNLTNERASKLRHYPKKDVLIAPVKCFSDSEISRSLTEVALQVQSLSVVANHPKSDLSTVN